MNFDNGKSLGFGCMRLPMNGDKVDYEEFCRMTDKYLESGFNYFDTAHGYIDGKSETAIRDCLSKRHPRESFVLANKLSSPYFEREEDIVPFFESQLKNCGVEYFDFYLFHALNRNSYEKYKACKAFETVQNLKKEGKIKHIAMSFHDTADILDKILCENPCIEAVQLQINYLDYDDPGVQSKKCYDIAEKHNKPVIVMEPVKGGALVNLPQAAAKIVNELNPGASLASFAIRYAASLPRVFMVLSGMGNMDMMNDNINTLKGFKPFTSAEELAAANLRNIIRKCRQIQCTKCEYCLATCSKEIKIPYIFEAYNTYLSAKATHSEAKEKLPSQGGKASDCIGCGKCEAICPQGLKIRDLLSEITRRFGLK